MKNKQQLLALAISIAANGFKDVLDKGGEAYILHCIRVMQVFRTVDKKILAILHDCTEDEVCTITQLREWGFPEDILADLDLLHHKDGEDYLDVYIKKVSTSKRATEIKLADLADNSNLSRLKGLTKKDFERMEKYQKAYVYLSSEV